MWDAGGCQGNDCLYSNCSGDPVLTTPLTCEDQGMDAQFRHLIKRYTGTGDDLRHCTDLVGEIMIQADITDFPTVTWCQSRESILGSAELTNWTIFWVVIIQTVAILVSIPLMHVYVVLWKKARPLHGGNRFVYTSMSDSQWLKSLRSEDDEQAAFETRQRERAHRTTLNGSIGSLPDSTDNIPL